jgi:hypothetical protein
MATEPSSDFMILTFTLQFPNKSLTAMFQISHGSSDLRSLDLAHRLLSRGVLPHFRDPHPVPVVPVWMETSREMYKGQAGDLSRLLPRDATFTK